MPRQFNRPHFDISAHAAIQRYKPPSQNMGGGGAPRIREAHGRMLRSQLQAAFREVQTEAQTLDGVDIDRAPGAYYEVELTRGAKAEKLDRKTQSIVSGAVKIDPANESVSAVVYIPDASVDALDEIFQDYAEGELTTGGKPQRDTYVAPIEAIRKARLLSFWTDAEGALPTGAQDRIWWEVWCDPASVQSICGVFEHMNCRPSNEEQWLVFPESIVVPIYARRTDVELALVLAEGILELRRASDTPSFFVDDERENQTAWTNDLAERIVWPNVDVPRVCLLDTGVNRAHPLIEPALSSDDLHVVKPEWVPTDNVRNHSHGTEMAGLSLLGDLFPRLQDKSVVPLTHRLESVRIVPDGDFDPNEPNRYGSITLSGIAIAEAANPDQSRIFCLAITNEDHSGDRASSWSACIDRAAAGFLAGDEVDHPRRLVCVSAGNIRTMDASALLMLEDHPIEDPAQAWNAITVGGYTEKSEIDFSEREFVGHTPFANHGDVSPFSRNSVGWRSSKTPIKPEVVFEAGNRALSPSQAHVINCPSLELLTTGGEVDRLPISSFAATSAAAAQAARLAAKLTADHPEYWPETIRALIVHSAEWTEQMLTRFGGGLSALERKHLLRVFGYGVPSYDRATASASSMLALVMQQDLQPYRRDSGSVVLNECHYFELPWPRAVLEQYGDQQFQLKITLSYFVEPNPGKSAAIDPQKYQSFGLRFDLKRPRESLRAFKERVNAFERAGAGNQTAERDDGNWVLGPKGISAGSLHCDVWTGTGAQLASRNCICVKPIGGWWKDRTNPEICEQRVRYALVVTIISPDEEIDLYTPISLAIEPEIDVEIDV